MFYKNIHKLFDFKNEFRVFDTILFMKSKDIAMQAKEDLRLEDVGQMKTMIIQIILKNGMNYSVLF